MRLFEAMQQQTVKPNVVTYGALISACEKGKDPGLAWRIFNIMQEQGPYSNDLRLVNFTSSEIPYEFIGCLKMMIRIPMNLDKVFDDGWNSYEFI